MSTFNILRCISLRNLLEATLVVQCVLYVMICPYTKVEESFNLQAIHDILHHGVNLSAYDHHEYPGVVPRSFIGPLITSALSWPLVSTANWAGASKMLSQYMVRSVLGTCVCMAMIAYSRAVRKWLGPLVATFTLLVTMTQFHFLFYASRTLPNTYALAVVLLAYRHWILQQHWKFLFLSGVAILIFRSELVLLLGLLLVGEWLSGRISLWDVVKICAPASVVILGLTVLLDSVFWGYWLWPEGVVFWYNAVMNKSSNWGTSPFLWYFYSALPRACLVALPLGAWGVWAERRVRGMTFCALLFVLLYSALPHKELRFIVYTFPLISTAAAAGAADIWLRRRRFRLPLRLLLLCSLIASLVVSLGFLVVSTTNYPGGVAMDTLHKMATKRDREKGLTVHIDVEPAQTGVSRFTELHSNWRYFKTEDLKPGGETMLAFDVLIARAGQEQHYSSTHDVVAVVDGFAGLRRFTPLDPIHSITKRKFVILRRMRTKQ